SSQRDEFYHAKQIRRRATKPTSPRQCGGASRNSFHLSPFSGLSSSRSTMGTPASSPSWQPITFGGVASFAHGSFGRLFVVQFIMALLVAGSVSVFLATAWFPVVEKAIARLPEK